MYTETMPFTLFECKTDEDLYFQSNVPGGPVGLSRPPERRAASRSNAVLGKPFV
jgi:hypothetical protein